MKRAGGNSSGSSLSVTSSLSKEANTNLIAHNNNGLPLRTSSLNEETNTNLIAHNDNDNTNSGAKIQQKYDTAKSDVNKLSEFKTAIEQR